MSVSWTRIFQSLWREPPEEKEKELRSTPLSQSPFTEKKRDEIEQEFAWAAAHPSTPPTMIHQMLPYPITTASPVESSPGKKEKEKEEGVPEWLSIFFDLAWTTTFSNLTSNATLSTNNTVLAYAVFFALCWWLWAADAIYQTKYFTNDLYHRGMLLVQLAIFGTLASFTNNFDPFAYIDPQHSAVATYTQDEYSRNSQLAISALFAGSRVLLTISYSRLAYYAYNRPKKDAHWVSMLKFAGVYAFSALSFGAAWLLISVDLQSMSVIGKLVLWASGIVLELFAYIWIRKTDDLVETDTMGERLGTLTTIILGEGLNGIAGTLIYTASTIGFGPMAGGQAVAATVIIAFGCGLYFDGNRTEDDTGKKRRSRFNLLCHFPLHISLILLLEGAKNILLISSISSSILWFTSELPIQPDGAFTAFRSVGINFTEQLDTYLQNVATQSTNLTANQFALSLEAQALFGIVNNFHLPDTPDGSLATLQQLINEPWMFINTLELSALIDSPIAQALDASSWVPLVGGLFVAALAAIMLVNDWVPAHRYVWGRILGRVILALVLFIMCIATYTSLAVRTALVNSAAYLPVISATFVGLYVVDQILNSIAVRRSIHREKRRRESVQSFQRAFPMPTAQDFTTLPPPPPIHAATMPPPLPGAPVIYHGTPQHAQPLYGSGVPQPVQQPNGGTHMMQGPGQGFHAMQ